MVIFTNILANGNVPVLETSSQPRLVNTVQASAAMIEPVCSNTYSGMNLWAAGTSENAVEAAFEY